MFFSRLLKDLRTFRSTRQCTKFPSVQIQRRFYSNEKEFEGIKQALEADNQRKTLSDQEGTLKGEKRILIGFTCKKCQHRTHRTMSHHAYHHGIVLIECSGCQSRHLIADNLGWFKDTPNAARRIEEMSSLEIGEIRRSIDFKSEDEGKGKGLVELLK